MFLVGSLEGTPPRLRVELTHLSVLSPSELEPCPCVHVSRPFPQQALCIDYLYLLSGEEARPVVPASDPSALSSMHTDEVRNPDGYRCRSGEITIVASNKVDCEECSVVKLEAIILEHEGVHSMFCKPCQVI